MDRTRSTLPSDEGAFWCAADGALPTVTYAAVPGPQYETAAEVAVLRSLGADVVGMSAAAEVRAALDEGLRVVVLSVVTNAAGETVSDAPAELGGAGATSGETDVPGGSDGHDRVLAVGRAALPLVRAALATAVDRWEPGA